MDSNTGQLIQDITPLLQFGVPFLLEERDVVLRAVLADGATYEQDLSTANPRFDPDSLNLHLSQELAPSSFQVLRGFQTAGDLAELTSSDDQRLSMQPGFTINSDEPPVWITTELNTPVQSPENLRLMVEANASTPNVRQVVELFNWGRVILKNQSISILKQGSRLIVYGPLI